MSKAKWFASGAIAALALVVTAAVAQINNPGIFQSGAVTFGHLVTWGPGAGQVQDGGIPGTGTVGTVTNTSPTGTITVSPGAPCNGPICASTFDLPGKITAGSTGDASHVAAITYDAQGRLTAAAATLISIPFTQVTGSLACAQLPALTGDVTTAACAATVVKVNGVAFGASPSTDMIPIITAANTATYTAVPNCVTGALNYATGTHTFACGAQLAIPGEVSNLKAFQATAAGSATITPTADAVNVCVTLGGQCYTITGYSQAFNGAGTGAGGMDTGAIPTSGFVALYAIFNPAGPTVSILGKTCAVSCPTIYNGANMPGGFTASALLTVLPTTATPNIAQSFAIGRKVATNGGLPLNSTTASSACTSVSLSTSVPPNAVKVSGQLQMSFASIGALTTLSLFIGAENTCSTGFQQLSVPLPVEASSSIVQVPFTDLPIVTPQTIFAGWANGGTTPITKLNIQSYTIPEAI